MTVPEQIRVRLSRWCAARVPESERGQWKIGYTSQDREITIIDRRPPAFPELDAEWSSTPLARLRLDDPEPGVWSLYRQAGDGGWQRESSGADPLALLDDVRN